MTDEQRDTATPPWEFVVMISAALVLIGSFLPFFNLAGGVIRTQFGAVEIPDLNWNAWSNALSLFPVTALVVVYAVAVGGQLALRRWTNATLPERIAGFTWSDLRLLLGTLATLTMLGYAFRDLSFPEGSIDKGIGLYLVTLASIGLLVGAVMERAASKGTPAAAPPAAASLSTAEGTGPRPGPLVMVGGGALVLVASFLSIGTAEGESINAWQQPLFPLFVVPALLGVVVAAHVALTTFANVSIPGRILGVEWRKVHLAFGIHAGLMMLGFLIANFFFSVLGETIPEPSRDVGFWLMLLGALGVAVGAIIAERERTAAPAQGTSESTSPPPGYWKASDGNWYPPDQRPGNAPPGPSS